MKTHRSKSSSSCIALLVIVCARAPTLSSAQAPQPPAWQTGAGGKMLFEVAAIHPAAPGAQGRANVDFSAEDTPVPPGGIFSASSELLYYIEFAYKIMPTQNQEATMLAHLPKWVATQPFVIEAKAPILNPTKDQMRLMMQSLLTDRFKLRVHFETHELPALALVSIKPGKLGPRLRPHAEGLACDAKWTRPPDRTATSVPPGGFMPTCGSVAILTAPNHTFIFGARDLTMDHVALYLSDLIPFGRPIVNQTGLAGTFDLSLQFTPERGFASASAANTQPDSPGETAFEALKEQLGLTLRPTKAPIETLIIDHVERPSPN
jgi:bla regulator protein blaR1